ncbi:MAG: ATP-binding cassette domain-containing protein [Alphaproteobacteria bacterium]
MPDSTPPLLQVEGLRKSFGGVHAVEDVNFDIERGEVLALVGDNGAGKSTVVKMISGAYARDAGQIRWEGREVDPRSPEDAKFLGIETMYQDLALVPDLDPGGNIFLGCEPSRRWLGFLPMLDRAEMRRRSEQLLQRVRINLPSLQVPVRQLSGGQRQATAIARFLLSERAKLIIMDEPTAAMGVQEQRKVLDLISHLREQGISILVISHNLDHVFSVADRILVLRGGRVAGVVRRTEADKATIVGLIVGGTVQ